MNTNSIKNQGIKGNFVSREVYCNVNDIVEYILSKDDKEAPFTWDDVENLYALPEYCGKYINFSSITEDQREEYIKEAEEEKEKKEEILNDLHDKEELTEKEDQEVTRLEAEIEEIEEEIEEVRELETEPQEVFEWWIVSPNLYYKLQKRGEPVIKSYGQCYWGRTTTGQAILLDSVISEICQEMGILEGQPNEWK
jgi:hypothetical protein